MSEQMQKLTIMGSGPAGLTAAIYAGRANLEPLVVEGFEPGGQLTLTSDVENFPGFPDGVVGPELMTRFKQQAERFGTKFILGNIDEADLSKPPFKLKIGGKEVLTEALIIASGASARWLGLESEAKFKGRGVSTCATCDGAFYKDQEVAVVGGGDSAMEEAVFLTKFASKVTLIHRRQEFRASKIMLDRAKANKKIEFVLDSVVKEIKGDKGVESIVIENLKTKETNELKADGIFVAIGHVPNTQLFKDQLEMNESGYLILKGQGTETSIPGVFLAGDVHDFRYRQAITAAGSGCKAAMDAEKWLEAQEA